METSAQAGRRGPIMLLSCDRARRAARVNEAATKFGIFPHMKPLVLVVVLTVPSVTAHVERTPPRAPNQWRLPFDASDLGSGVARMCAALYTPSTSSAHMSISTGWLMMGNHGPYPWG